MDLLVLPVRKAGLKMLFLLCKQANTLKTSTIIKTMLANMTPGAFLSQPDISQDDGQLSLALNYEL